MTRHVTQPSLVHRSAERPPVRMAHLGLGAFHRAHQAWYTARAEGERWGIAAFTGRSPAAARLLAAQDSVYTLIERGASADSAEIIESIASAHDGADTDAWTRTLASADVTVVTLTVTEAGYAATAGPPTRLVQGLAARRAADAGPIAVVSCDNLPGNGRAMRTAVLSGAEPDLADWIRENVSFVDTMVDRITPATTDADRAVAARLTGMRDEAPVVAEPFSEWIIAGDFPGGRPAWESAGARVVDDVEPYEERKLWLLNAGHSLLAWAGSVRGYESVDAAFADDELRALLEQLWDEQRAVVSLPAAEVDAAIVALRERFANPRIRHSLDQIAQMGALKLPVRVLDPMRRRASRGLPAGEAQRATVGAWAEYLSKFGATDAPSADIAERLLRSPGHDRVDLIINTLSKETWQ